MFDVYVPPNPDAETRAPCLEGSSDRPALTLATYANDTPEARRVRALCERRVIDENVLTGKRVRGCTNWRSTRVKKVPPTRAKARGARSLDRSARARVDARGRRGRIRSDVRQAGAPRERSIPAPETADPSVGTDDVHANNRLPPYFPTPKAARVFLERSPYVSWRAQRPVFAHPAFNGVIHPDLPVWAGEPGIPEPAVGSDAAAPRISRLAKTEVDILPDFHVQTVAASRCRSAAEARQRIAAASDAGASAILMVTGDAPDAARGARTTHLAWDSTKLLREAVAMRERGEVHEDVTLACVANPSLEGAARDPTARLRAKLDAGAEMVVTQPAACAPAVHRAWWDAVRSESLHRECDVVFGVTYLASHRSVRRWQRLCGLTTGDTSSDATEEAEETASLWEEMERSMDAATFERWRDERLDLAVAAALADVDARGVHVMPVTEEGYAGVGRVADAIGALAARAR